MIKEARIYDGEKTISSINGVEKTRHLCVKIKLEPFITSQTKIKTQNGLKTYMQDYKTLIKIL